MEEFPWEPWMNMNDAGSMNMEEAMTYSVTSALLELLGGGD